MGHHTFYPFSVGSERPSYWCKDIVEEHYND